MNRIARSTFIWSGRSYALVAIAARELGRLASRKIRRVNTIWFARMRCWVYKRAIPEVKMEIPVRVAKGDGVKANRRIIAMKYLACVFASLLLCGALSAQMTDTEAKSAPQPAAKKPVVLMTGIGNLHHPVSTKNAQAQQFFDQGLRLIFAFNHDEAARSFRRAADLDPKLGMAYWGVAETVGPNYNDPASDDRFQAAHDAIQKAVELSTRAPANEQAYINAMAKRFPADPKADRRKAAEDYRDAMREVVKNFPDDLDAATLFAESGMNLHPWGLWHVDGTPEEGTEEIVATLESVLKRDPDHMGAIHYYIHSVEASRNPERALAGANWCICRHTSISAPETTKRL